MRGKGGKERVVPLGEEAAHWLAPLPARGAAGARARRRGRALPLGARPPARHEHAPPALRRTRTGSATRSRRTCSRAAPTCARSRSCSATARSRRRRSTATSTGSGSAASTTEPTPAPDAPSSGFLALLAARRAPRTVDAYRRDLDALRRWLGAPAAPRDDRGARALPRASCAPTGSSPATIARRRRGGPRASSGTSMLLGARADNPAAELELPRRVRKLPRTLSPARGRAADRGRERRRRRARCATARSSSCSTAPGSASARRSASTRAASTSTSRLVRVRRQGRQGARRPDRPPGGARRCAATSRRGRPYLDRRHRPELFLNAQGGPLTRAGAFLILRRLAGEGRARAGARPPAPAAALASRRTCSRAAPTSAASRRCSATPTSATTELYTHVIRPPPPRAVLPRAPARAAQAVSDHAPTTAQAAKMNERDAHPAASVALLVATTGVGVLMARRRRQKSALEWKRPQRRRCPSCGREIRGAAPAAAPPT